MKITLNEIEQRLAKHIAKRRYETSREKGIVNAKFGPQSNEETDIEGAAGELAFCKIANIYPDFSTNRWASFDAILPGGKTIDVKTTKYKTGELRVRKKPEKISADLFALMIGEMPTYRLAGIIAAEDLFSIRNVHIYDDGARSFHISQGRFPRGWQKIIDDRICHAKMAPCQAKNSQLRK